MLSTRFGPVVVGPVDPARTYALRQQVLRPHQRVEEMDLLGTGDDGGVVVGAVTPDGEILSTAAVGPEAPPPSLRAVAPGARWWRLRSMATRADVRGGGLGAAVLDVAVSFVAGGGGGRLWCSARVPASAFYERAGFRPFGEEWVEEHIGPHVLMWRTVPGPASARPPES